MPRLQHAAFTERLCCIRLLCPDDYQNQCVMETETNLYSVSL